MGSPRQPRGKGDDEQPDDAKVAELARHQHGVVGRHQLRALGLGTRAIQHRIEAGPITPPLPCGTCGAIRNERWR
jgi:hypothetical protein